MRTRALQYLYLQKPVSTIVFLCLLSVLPWAATNSFSTKGEPREAAVAVSMLESGDWTLPKVYADEFAYKPPMMHWLETIASLPGGEVTEFSSRLPSAIAFTVLLACVLLFFGKRVRFQEAFIATLLLLTCVEIHRAGLAARVDMLLTAFTVTGLFAMYRWEDNLELKGLPITIPILLGGAILTKGPVGLVVPLFVFAVYIAMLRRYRWTKIVKSLVYVAVSSALIPSVWYIEAWRMGGGEFADVVLAENFGRFFHLQTPGINYELGHENGAWYNFLTLAAGFVPWTLLLVISFFGLKYKKPAGRFAEWIADIWRGILSLDKIRLFSLVASVCIVFFYCLPSSKRSVYLMPAYPFIALFIAQYLLIFIERHSRVMRIFSVVMATIAAVVVAASVLQMTGALDLNILSAQYLSKPSQLMTVQAVAKSLSPSAIALSVLALVAAMLITVCYQIWRKSNIKMLYSTIFLMFALNLFIDGVVMRGVHSEGSAKPFAAELRRDFPIDRDNIFVVNNLREYANLYGLNFYLGNCFHNIDIEQPASGYFLAAEKDIDAIAAERAHYVFTVVRTSERYFPETHGRIVLCRFQLR